MNAKLPASYRTDGRHRDIGLTDEECIIVLSVCRRFVNIRDNMEDLYQTALTELYLAFKRYETLKKVIRFRPGFIYSVVKCALSTYYIRANRNDMIYHCENLYDDISSSEKYADGTSVTDLYADMELHNAEIGLDQVLSLQLDSQTKDIVISNLVKGYSQADLALRYNTTQPAISSKSRKAQIKIRPLLKEHLNIDNRKEY